MTLTIDPCIPRNWPNFSITFRYHSASYKIRVENPSSVTRGVALMNIDGKLIAGRTDIALSRRWSRAQNPGCAGLIRKPSVSHAIAGRNVRAN